MIQRWSTLNPNKDDYKHLASFQVSLVTINNLKSTNSLLQRKNNKPVYKYDTGEFILTCVGWFKEDHTFITHPMQCMLERGVLP